VRRSSGGGAILHDREVTYCLAVPTRGLSVGPLGLYRAVHGALVESLAEIGLSAYLHTTAEPASPDEPFLCFQRRSDGDVILDGAKIAGSAQRRRRGALLQHGSILLARSQAAPELPGIVELGASGGLIEDLVPAWLTHLPAALGVRFEPSELTGPERQIASRIVHERFSRPEWNERR
jgi:lipoate-protein ligase A